MFDYLGESSRLLRKEFIKISAQRNTMNYDAPDGDTFSKYSDDFSDENSETKPTNRHYYYKRVGNRMVRHEYIPRNGTTCK